MNIVKKLTLISILLLTHLLQAQSITEAFMASCEIAVANPENFKGRDREFIERTNSIIDNAINAFSAERINGIITTGIIMLARIALAMHLDNSPDYAENMFSRAEMLLMTTHKKLVYECSADRGAVLPLNITEKDTAIEMARFCANITNPKGIFLWHKLISQGDANQQENATRSIVPHVIKSIITASIFKYITMEPKPAEVDAIINQLILKAPQSHQDQINLAANYFNNISTYEFNLLIWELDAHIFDILTQGHDLEIQEYTKYINIRTNNSAHDMGTWHSLIH